MTGAEHPNRMGVAVVDALGDHAAGGREQHREAGLERPGQELAFAG